MIRSVLAEIADESLAQGVRIQYGGSVKPGNAKELFGQPDIDGGLIGGAALEARSFVEIVRVLTFIDDLPILPRVGFQSNNQLLSGLTVLS